MSNALISYSPPEWAKDLKLIPKHKINLIYNETPIQPWPIETKNNAKIDIKRDDFTGIETTGNKIRKLEFLFADAIAKGSDCVITIGGLQSNHCRATAAVAARLGLKCYLCLRYTTEDPQELKGNLLLSRLFGAHIILFTPAERDKLGGNVYVLETVKKRLQSRGSNPYVITLGGSNALGTWGYLEATREIVKQIQEQKLHYDDIVVTAGSGGTLAGIALGNYLAKTGIRVWGICASDDANYFHAEINDILKDLGVNKRSEDLCTVVNGFVGRGYGLNTDEELKMLAKISQGTGVIVDPVYTLKSVLGMISLPDFKNRRVLYVHTGGIYGLFSPSKNWSVINNNSPVTQLAKI